MNELDIATLDIGHIDEKFPEKKRRRFSRSDFLVYYV